MPEKREIEYFVPDRALMGVSPNEFEHIKDRADIRVKAILPYVKGKVVLDIGCGSGYATYEYSKVAKSIVGLDISAEALKFAREHYPSVEFIQGDVLGDWVGKFDVIIATEMMEHISEKDWDRLLLNVKSALTNGGVFIGTIPVEGHTESWDSHKARYDKMMFQTKFNKYFVDGIITKMVFPWYYPSYFFRFIKEG
jgi:cyclopropane fatty-acyl-phospholipid synthase-like methyltransferase